MKTRVASCRMKVDQYIDLLRRAERDGVTVNQYISNQLFESKIEEIEEPKSEEAKTKSGEPPRKVLFRGVFGNPHTGFKVAYVRDK